MDYKITKSTIESYKLRHPSGMYWADINIDAHEKSGRIQIASDYGSWQYFWGSCGRSFKEFLTGLNMDYVAGKFKATNYFDAEETINVWRKEVQQSKSEGRLDKEKANLILEEIQDLDDQGIRDSGVFWVTCKEKEELMAFYDYMPDLYRTIEPGFKHFWEKVWPAFIAELKKELAESVELKEG